jgi:catechol 2,3-dioxygenase-like lactoylglutathione lyase family enzyme
MIRALHHMAFRCRNSEETRAFYEDVVGLKLTAAYELRETKTGRTVKALHTFFGMEDGSAVAFFEVPGSPFEFKAQHDFDLHIALETDEAHVKRVSEIARAKGLELRGPSDHGFIRSIYLRDPNGYIVELTVKAANYDALMRDYGARAHATLKRWTRENAGVAA